MERNQFMRLEIRNEFFYLGGKLISVFGNQMLVFVIAVNILEQTGSALSYAITLCLSVMVTLFFGPIAGVASDSINRKNLMIIFNIINAFTLLVISYQELSVNNIYICLVVTSICGCFYDNSSDAIKINLVPKNKINRLTAWSKGIDSFARIMTPIIAASLYNKVDVNFFIKIDGLTFLMAALLNALLIYKYKKDSKEEKTHFSFFQRWKIVFQYLKNKYYIKKIIVLFFLFNVVFSIESSVAVPYLLLNHLKFSTNKFSIIETGISIGLLLGSVLSIYLMNKQEVFSTISKLGILFIFVFINIILCTLLYGTDLAQGMSLFIYILLCLFLFGCGISLLEIPVQSYIQRKVDENYLGRVLTIIVTIVKIVNPIAYLIGGIMVDRINIAIVFALGIFLLIIILIVNTVWRLKEDEII